MSYQNIFKNKGHHIFQTIFHAHSLRALAVSW